MCQPQKLNGKFPDTYGRRVNGCHISFVMGRGNFEMFFFFFFLFESYVLPYFAVRLPHFFTNDNIFFFVVQ